MAVPILELHNFSNVSAADQETIKNECLEWVRTKEPVPGLAAGVKPAHIKILKPPASGNYCMAQHEGSNGNPNFGSAVSFPVSVAMTNY